MIFIFMKVLSNLKYHNTIKSDFKKFSKKEKKDYLDYLLTLRIPLEKYYFEQLSNSQKTTYIEDRIKCLDWLQDYEFKYMNSRQKEMYIYRKRYLSNEEFMRLPDDVKIYYLELSVYRKIQLTNKEFYKLTPRLKQKYANFLFEFPQTLDVEKSKYLSKENQKKYITKCIERGVSFSDEEINSLSDFSKKQYFKLKNINEIRSLVKKVIKETF